MSGRRVTHDIPHINMCESTSVYDKNQLRAIVEHIRGNQLWTQLRNASDGWRAAGDSLDLLAGTLRTQGESLASSCRSEDAASLQQALRRLEATARHLSTRSHQVSDYTSSSAETLITGVERFPADQGGFFENLGLGDVGSTMDNWNPLHSGPSTEDYQHALMLLNNDYLAVNSRLPYDVSADLPLVGPNAVMPPPPPQLPTDAVPAAPSSGGHAPGGGVAHGPAPAAVPAAPNPGVIGPVSATEHAQVPGLSAEGVGAGGGLAGAGPIASPGAAVPGGGAGLAPGGVGAPGGGAGLAPGGVGAPGGGVPAGVGPGGASGAAMPRAGGAAPGTGAMTPGGRPTATPGMIAGGAGRSATPGGGSAAANRPAMTQPGVLGAQAGNGAHGNSGPLAGRAPGGTAAAGAGRPGGTPGLIGSQSGASATARGNTGGARAGAGAGGAAGARGGAMPMSSTGRSGDNEGSSSETWLTEDDHPWRSDAEATPAVIG